jgi:ATP-dependent Clp protease adapter protein ClpS
MARDEPLHSSGWIRALISFPGGVHPMSSQQPADRSAATRDPVELPNQARPRERPRRHQLPPYKVILHQDPTLDLMFVIRTVMELTRFCRAEATHKMWEAYHCGRSILLITYKERAELYVEQFSSKGLTVSIEPA